MTPAKLRDVMQRLGLDTGPAAKLCGVKDRTARRWLAGERHVDASAARLLLLLDRYQFDLAEIRAFFDEEAAR